MKKEILEWIKMITISILLAVVITTFIRPVHVDGLSMYPTLNHRDYLISENIHSIHRGDIISFKSSIPISEEELNEFNLFQRMKLGKTKNLIKRVIAIAEDELLIQNGHVYVNGEQLEEDYIYDDYTYGDIHIQSIPKGKVFVLGDNRDNSTDSRAIGLVDEKDIHGKVFVRLLPLSQLGTI